jgi:tetratricopeptide (TPR) repeat protein
VSVWLDGDELPDSGPVFDLAVPLDGNVLEELRWYLEDYLVLPSGAYGERGQKVRERLAEWGAGMFRAVFGSGPARDAYVQVCRSMSDTKLVLRSSSPQLLALPWELMRDPARSTPLAMELAGVSRGLPSGPLTGTVPVPEGKLRVLMVIARPEGEADVGYQMIARPLLERLDAVGGKVDLVVLRPPTLDALVRTLSEASAKGTPFHLVHFDGHGKQGERWFPSSGSGDWYLGQPGEGVLVFEKPGGGADPVPASAVARVLRDAKVPVVVLNACQSGAIGKDLEAAIATRLMQEGTASVVAMSYSVYAVAAAEFMTAFYERLFAGDPVSAAVTAGRKWMADHNWRPSRRGDMPLEDWLVPVHYLRRDVSFSQAVSPRSGPLSLDEQDEEVGRSRPARFSGEGSRAEIDPAGEFIGRDWLTCQLEVAARLQRVVVLHGPGGTGKTELAKGFGRWWRDTGGVDDSRYVFFRSSEPGIAAFGLDAVVSQIGRALFGTDFDRCEPAERRAKVEQAVTGRRMLLIWDNFETLHSMPDPRDVTEPLDEDGRRELRSFLSMLAARGKSVVLITSRSPEPWLGDVRRIPVGGLSPTEANQYATRLLGPYPKAQARRHKPVFGDLMEWLNGHPLSMRLVLPHLDTTDPAVLLGALRGTTPLPGAAEDNSDRMTSLPASITYSYAHLSEQARRLLPMVSVLQPVAQADLLAAVSNRADTRIPERFRGTEEVWRHVLREAAGIGLLTPLVAPSTVDTYQLHPVLPAYLAAQWRQEEPARYDADRESVSRAAAKVYAPFCAWLLSQINEGNTQMAFGFIDIQYRTLTGVLDYALDHGLLVEAAYIVILLHQYWRSRGLTAEEHAWADRARLAAAEARTESLEDPATGVWLELCIYGVTRDVNRFRLDDAYRLAGQVRGWLEARPRSALQRQYLARVYDEFGRIARSRGNAAEAEDWDRMARAADLAVADEPASTAGRRGQERAASSRRGGQLNAAAAELHRGDTAMERGQLDEAEENYRRSLAISMEVGDRPGQASACRQLGTAVLKRGLHTEAESRYRDALALYEELCDKPEISQIYVLLGVIAKSCRRLDEAGNWYRQALSTLEELGDPLGAATTLVALIDLALAQGDEREAQRRAISCVKLIGNLPHPDAENMARAVVPRIRQLGVRTFEEAWRRETGTPLPRVVRDQMQSGEVDD